MGFSSHTSAASSQQASPFAFLAGTSGLPIDLLLDEQDLLATAEQVVADDAMAWEPIETAAAGLLINTTTH